MPPHNQPAAVPQEILDVIRAARALLADANARADLYDARCRDLRSALKALDARND